MTARSSSTEAVDRHIGHRGFVWFRSQILTVSTRCEAAFTKSGDTSLEVKRFVCCSSGSVDRSQLFTYIGLRLQEACFVRVEHLERVSPERELLQVQPAEGGETDENHHYGSQEWRHLVNLDDAAGPSRSRPATTVLTHLSHRATSQIPPADARQCSLQPTTPHPFRCSSGCSSR